MRNINYMSTYVCSCLKIIYETKTLAYICLVHF